MMSTVKISALEETLLKFGFTRYESRAYMSLLEHNPVSGYELSQASGVPRSAIYDIMRKLEKSGLVHSMTSKPKQYVPLQPKELMERLKNEFNSNLNDLEDGLTSLDVSIEEDHLWTLSGYNELIDRSRQMINSSENVIFISLWTREAKALKSEIEAAIKRGVKVIVFSFTEMPFKFDNIYSYGLKESKLENIWNHHFLLVADKEEVLMGEARKGLDKKAAWTKNQSLVNIAITNIILDITLYGLRLNVNVSENVSEMYNGSIDYLGDLLNEKNIQTDLKQETR